MSVPSMFHCVDKTVNVHWLNNIIDMLSWIEIFFHSATARQKTMRKQRASTKTNYKKKSMVTMPGEMTETRNVSNGNDDVT